MPAQKGTRRKQAVNPLVAGIEDFVFQQSSAALGGEDTRQAGTDGLNKVFPSQDDDPATSDKTLNSGDLPKRYIVYQPMLLLGPTFSSHTPVWEDFYRTLNPSRLRRLYQSIADAFCRSGNHVTHIAMNAPIQATLEIRESGQQENIMRSPVNLQPLFGDFGPAAYHSTSRLTPADMDAALWVETSQVGGIRQVWAPRWTMFSRGNVREKARIFGQQGVFPGLTPTELGQPLSHVDVVDFYVGIGYFAFPYLKRGVRTVFGWDINQWSIEGLRRGCEKNGWQCLVIMVEDYARDEASTIEQIVKQILSSLPPRCVAFCGDNGFVVKIMSSISESLRNTERALNIRHANLGLLPTSQGAWVGAIRVLSDKTGGWLHVHENAEIVQVPNKEQEVLSGLKDVLDIGKTPWQISCENTEMVKTYAPGVGHYVFDVKLWPAR